MQENVATPAAGDAPARISGTCDTRFSALRDAFLENFAARGEIGASVAVTVDGVPVVDLWGGYRDAARSRPWERDTIVTTNSVTKEVTALALHLLADRGRIDLDAPVADYWPEFAQNGKATLPVRYVLDHRAGLPVLDSAWPGMAYDWKAMIDALAAQAPLWEPGTTPCYHAATQGYLMGEIIRRVSGKMPGAFIREEISGPLGLDWHLGLTPEEEARCADFIANTDHTGWSTEHTDSAVRFERAWRIFPEDENYNSPQWRRLQVPSSGGHGNARALARLCGALARGGEVDGVRLISEAALRNAIEPQWEGPERVGRTLRLGLGLLLNCKGTPMGPNPGAFGMFGAGGQVAIADPVSRIGFAYTMNRMDPASGFGPRASALIGAALGL